MLKVHVQVSLDGAVDCQRQTTFVWSEMKVSAALLLPTGKKNVATDILHYVLENTTDVYKIASIPVNW